MLKTATYESYKEKYDDFTYPMLSLTVGGKDFGDNKAKLVVSDFEADLSVGYEASVVTFSIYNVYDQESNTYRTKDFKTYAMLGSAVEVSMGYGNQMEKIFVGFISQVRFVSGEGIFHHVEVTAMDVKGLMMSNSYARQMTASNYGDAVQEIFEKPVYQKLNSQGIYSEVKITGTPDKKEGGNEKNSSSTLEMVSESDYEFVVKAAKYSNYEFFVDTGIVYFRKSKETKEECLMELSLGQGIFYYDISYDITGLVKKVEVRGMDVSKGEPVSATKQVSNKISLGNKAKSLISQTQRVALDAGVTSKDVAKLRAESMMEEISYRFGSIECECVGLPELKPGHFIDITGLGDGCDNRFYITNTRHTLSDTEGYRTYITGKAAALK